MCLQQVRCFPVGERHQLLQIYCTGPKCRILDADGGFFFPSANVSEGDSEFGQLVPFS